MHILPALRHSRAHHRNSTYLINLPENIRPATTLGGTDIEGPNMELLDWPPFSNVRSMAEFCSFYYAGGVAFGGCWAKSE